MEVCPRFPCYLHTHVLIFQYLQTHPPPHTQHHAYSPENEDYWYVTTQPRTLHYAVSHQTEDVMWPGAIQPRTSPYTVNRGHVLNSIFALFSSSYTPTNWGPSAVSCRSSLSCEILCVSSFDGDYPHTPTYPHLPCTHTQIHT